MLLIVLGALFCSSSVLGSQSSRFSSSLGFNILNTGFHRELQYSLSFSGPLHKPKCEFMLVQNLPASIFVNTDELNDLKRLSKIEAYVPVYMDVEIPASKAFHVQIYIFGDVEQVVNITLPIHLRYQTPTDIKFVRVEVYSPDLYIRCQEDDPAVKQAPTEDFPCRSSSKVTDYDRIKDIEVCRWQKFRFFNEPTTLSITIPAGDIHAYKFVLPITIAMSWLGCGYITYIIMKKTRNFKIKVN